MPDEGTNRERGMEEFLLLKGQRFVDSVYRSFLRRVPDQSGLDFYLRRLQAGIAKQQVLAEIAASREAQKVGDVDAGVRRLLRKARAANSWSNRLRRRFQGETRAVNAIRFEVDLLEDRLDGLVRELMHADNHALDDYGARSLSDDRAGGGTMRERAPLEKAVPNGFSPRLGPAATQLLSRLRP